MSKYLSEKRVIVDLNDFEKAQYLFQAVASGKYRVIVYGGAVRGGKTFNMLAALVIMLRTYPGARAAIVRKDLQTLKTNTLPTCLKVFPTNFLDLVNATKYIWKANNHLEKYGGHDHRSEIFFFGEQFARDPQLTRWDGLEINYIMLDQIEELAEATFDKAIERCGSYVIPDRALDDQPVPVILASCNPSKNWVRRVIYDPYVKGELPDDWLFIPATIDENPHIPKIYIEGLERLKDRNPGEYRRRRHGDWDYREGDDILFETDEITDMYTNEFVEPGAPYITADIALEGSDKFVIGVWSGWRLETVYHYDKTDGRDVLNILNVIRRRHRVPVRNIVYDADGVGNFLKGWLKTAFSFRGNAQPLPLPGAPKKEKPNYKNLRAECYYLLADRVREYSIYAHVNPFVEDQMTEELEAIRRAQTTVSQKLDIISKDEITRMIGRSPDFADMLMMRIVFDLKKRRKSRAKAH